MRQDMSKVIVERPRRGGKYVRKGRDVRDPDVLTSHEGMRMPYLRNYNNKELNENLAPLLRFLESRVGQNWDDVYSEICENIRITNAVQEHIRVHVMQYVETHTSVDHQGRIWINSVRPCLLDDDQYTRLYVDPTTKILRSNPNFRAWSRRCRERKIENAKELQALSRSLPGGIELRKHNGVWYQVELKEIPAAQEVVSTKSDGTEYKYIRPGYAYDVILRQTLSRDMKGHVGDMKGNYHGSYMYCASKRQLNHSELRRYEIQND